MSHGQPPGTDGYWGPASGARPGWRSLERRLPLVMFGLLALILAVTLALTYATLIEASMSAINTRLRTVSRDSTLRRALLDEQRGGRPPGDSISNARVRAALSRAFLGGRDSSATAELWTVDGRRVAHAGADIR